MDLFDKLEVPNFEVASDAFSSFKVGLHVAPQSGFMRYAGSMHSLDMDLCRAAQANQWQP